MGNGSFYADLTTGEIYVLNNKKWEKIMSKPIMMCINCEIGKHRHCTKHYCNCNCKYAKKIAEEVAVCATPRGFKGLMRSIFKFAFGMIIVSALSGAHYHTYYPVTWTERCALPGKTHECTRLCCDCGNCGATGCTNCN